MTLQQKIVNNKWYRTILPIVLTIAVLIVFVFSPFEQAHAIAGVDDAIIVVLIAGLAAVGITFATTGGFDTLNEVVGNLLNEYAIDNNSTVYGVTNGLNASANSAGRLLLNNRFITLISTFASWLVNKYGLTNNAVISVSTPGTELNGLVTYDLPLGFRYQALYYEYTRYYAENAYAIIATSNGDTPTNFRFVFVSEIPNIVYRTTTKSNGTTTEQNYEMSYNNSFGCYAYETAFYNIADYADPNWVMYQENDVIAAINEEWDVDVNNIGISINTGTINPPLDDSNYTAGDGGILDVGATWGVPYTNVVYGEIPTTWPNVVDGTVTPTITYDTEAAIEEQLPEPSEIENLPGGMTIFDPDNPDSNIGEMFNLRLSTIWHYVQQWIADFSVAGGLLWNTAISLPNPVINMVYAMMVVALIFGLIKIFRG